MKTKKLSATAQWMLDHPNDVPCPATPSAATAWRRKRFANPNFAAERAKYDAAMAESRMIEQRRRVNT
jgi:hypothetical protein